MSRAISIDTIRDAARTVYGAAIRTPLVPLGVLAPGGPEVFLKLEMLQPIGSFKIRGAYNAVRRLTPEQLAEGVWTVSAGNAAQGVALAARKMGARCSVMVMDTAPEAKLGAINRLGATIVKADYNECWKTVESHGSPRMTGHFVHPFDDDDFISGNGTAGLEILEDLPDVDAVVAAVGGGGLLSGIGVVFRALQPQAKVYAAEPETAAPLKRSMERGAASRFDEWQSSFVDGAGGKSVLATMWPLLSEYVHESIVVSLDEAARAMRLVAERARVIAEGAGACAVAAAVSPTMTSRGHKKVVAVVSGGNVDLAKFAQLVGACPKNLKLETQIPMIPERLHRLPELASDLWWTWNPQAREVFRLLDYPLWRQTAHNPVLMLRNVSPELLGIAAADDRFVAVYDAALDSLDRARAAQDTWWRHSFPDHTGPIAYFSAEFALHQSLPIYAGGLGVLAGDHCKEASDLGVPLIGIGFMYPQGYFHQSVSPEGWQKESYERLNWNNAPIEPAVTAEGKTCIVPVPLGNRSVLVQVWRVRLGRVKLYLLDTDLEENAPWDRELSARLYGGDRETRIQQEIILGIGGVRALKALGLAPAVWHLNEGHAAFVVLQRIRDHIESGLSFDEALEEVRRTTVFTTHTPVPAGHDAFPFSLVETHLAGCWGTLGEYRDRFMQLGAYDNGSGPQFNMTALALRAATGVNAVSQLHGVVTREMWGPIWPGVPAERRPVRAITNGIHMPTWLSNEMAHLFDDHLPADWRDRHDEQELWSLVQDIPDAALWEARSALRQYLFAFIRERARQRWREEQVSAARVVGAGTLLDPNALTIGFARRFTGYKRPELIFHNPERLRLLLNASRRPLQIVFAGKAHPADETGKHHLQQVYRRAIDPAFGGRIAFVDDYDLHVAHFLVQGCDVWLNNPRKPLEASGTSGMKASLNGVPHLSIGDGWWAEGYTGDNGWLIDAGEIADPEAQDAADAARIYDLLETQIVPAFYDRDANEIPHRWIAVVKESIRTVAPRFCARRMVKEYVERMYAPGIERTMQVSR